jgi:formylglycine-generating enzyme required for sulfatase activity
MFLSNQVFIRARLFAALLACLLGSEIAGRAAEASQVELSIAGTNLWWKTSATNGTLKIEISTNLALTAWVPYRSFWITNDSGLVPLQLGANSHFYRASYTEAFAGMKLIPAGSFRMGEDSTLTYTNEKPMHQVYVSEFYLAQFETTNEEVRDLMQWAYDNGRIGVNRDKVTNKFGSTPLVLQLKGVTDAIAHNQMNFTNGQFYVDAGMQRNPCVGITWYGAAMISNWKSEREGLQPCFNPTNWVCDFSKNGYRLPTEAEWEKAARGGLTNDNYPWSSPRTASYLNQITTNYCTFTPVGLPHPFRTTEVGFYDGVRNLPATNMVNGYGLYDMAGNVREWCYDWFDPGFYSAPEAKLQDTTGPAVGTTVTFPNNTSGPTRVSRGGSFDEQQKNVRCAYRGQAYQSSPEFAHWYHGMRLARRP